MLLKLQWGGGTQGQDKNLGGHGPPCLPVESPLRMMENDERNYMMKFKHVIEGRRL